MRPGKRRALDKCRESNRLIDELEQLKASIRARVEHPFRVIKRQFGHVLVRYRGLAKNTAHLHTLFALPNLWMARRQLGWRWHECARKARNALRHEAIDLLRAKDPGRAALSMNTTAISRTV